MPEGDTAMTRDTPPVPLPAAQPVFGAAGDQIGPYQLLELVGEGGFGEVWLAEQREPISRRVALKIIKPGMDSREVIARFEQERQALAMMDHPNIAKVLDAGTTHLGRPYFVMEYVKGEPITTFCDRSRLTVRQRLELFSMVCDAVQHAHMKGVIHRDLKPSNILLAVTDSSSHHGVSDGGSFAHGRPVIIDFGIAKAMAARLTDKTVYTEKGQLIGTPEYMSPEQAEMSEADIDVRTDVYSLGVVLYELLTGALPLEPSELRSAGQAAIRKMIREVEPVRPSTRLNALGMAATKIAAARRLQVNELAGQLRNELEWIPLKSLRKERNERYRSASELADDIANFLCDRPLIAGPESARYKLRKFVRRNRVAVSAGGAIFAALAIGVAGMAWQTGEARREATAARAAEAEQSRLRQLADQKTAEAETAGKRTKAINDFVITALQSSDPAEGGAQTMLVTDAMIASIRLLDAGEFRGDPDLETSLRQTIAHILNGNARSGEALVQAERSLAIARSAHNGDHLTIASSLDEVAQCMDRLGRYAEALPVHEEAYAMSSRLFTGDHPSKSEELVATGYCLRLLSRLEKSLEAYESALAMNKRMYGDENRHVASNLYGIATCLDTLGRSEEALASYRASLLMYRHLYAGDHPDVACGLTSIATCLDGMGRSAEAQPSHHEAVAMFRRLFKGDHPSVADATLSLASSLVQVGQYGEALLNYQESLGMFRRLFGDNHPNIAMALTSVGYCLQHMGRAAEALPEYELAAEMFQRLFREDHVDTASAVNNVACCLDDLGRYAEALPKHQAALEMRQRLFKGDHPDIASALDNLGGCLANLRRLEEALVAHETSLEMYQRLFPGDHPDGATALANVAYCLDLLGRRDDAALKYQAAIEMRRRLYPKGHPSTANALYRLALCLSRSGRSADALQSAQQAAELASKVLPEGHPIRKKCEETLRTLREAK